ncbi:MAG: ABC transporter ATP-binding protein [Bacillota bacterium]
MNGISIRVENLGKQYRIKPQERYHALRDVLTQNLSAPYRMLVSALSGKTSAKAESPRAIWALKDISFRVRPGEVLGIIGRNGAGKSTLLKILSRITQPTEGFAEIHGRVGSLLEVGTGFHPELTGRENIYLNGAILGMRKREIKHKFDEIVAFSEIDKFIDTPVKFYSSGMYVRLAFAVAAHLEPEILLVDEVLAVGDASFQKRCIGKMKEVSEGGRTVLFVSHNMPAVNRLCERTLLIDHGQIIRDGPTAEITSYYLMSDLGTSAQRQWKDVQKAPGDHMAKLRSVRICNAEGETQESVDIRQPVGIEMEYWVLDDSRVLTPNIHVFDSQGTYVFVSNDSYDPVWGTQARQAGIWKSTCWIPGNLLSEGTYIVGVAVSTLDPVQVHFFERDAVSFQVIDSLDGDTARGRYTRRIPGVIRPLLKWTAQYQSSISSTEP